MSDAPLPYHRYRTGMTFGEVRMQLAEEARQAALSDSPQALRNKSLFIMIVIAFLASLFLCGLLTSYRVAGWFGLIAFATLWLVPSAIMMAWAIWDSPEIQ